MLEENPSVGGPLCGWCGLSCQFEEWGVGEAGTSLADVLRKEHIDQFNMQIPQQAEMSRILGGVSSAHVNDEASARTNSLVGKVRLSLEQTRREGRAA